MSAVLAKFRAAGVTFAALPDGRLRAHGTLTDELRAAIQDHKLAILSELAAANEPERDNPIPAADDRRACTACGNLSPRGRCLAVWRGDCLGNAGREYNPVPDVPRRCEGYTPLSRDPDPRTGSERWPSLCSPNIGGT